MNHFRNFFSLFFYLLPTLMVFLGCMLTLGSYEMDLWSVVAVTAGIILYKPCVYAANRLWVD